MMITREIHLTYDEKLAIHREMERYFRELDIKEKLDELGYAPSDEQFKKITERFNHTLDNNGSYWESYWMNCENVIEEVMEEE